LNHLPIFTELGLNVMPLKATSTPYFLISNNHFSNMADARTFKAGTAAALLAL
jgi:hypothetical protein